MNASREKMIHHEKRNHSKINSWLHIRNDGNQKAVSDVTCLKGFKKKKKKAVNQEFYIPQNYMSKMK